MERTALVEEALNYVTGLFAQQSRPDMYFHNLEHTLDVFDSAVKIGDYSALSAEAMEILQLAALFHDTGYLYHYTGHEDNSKLIAGNFLMQQQYPSGLIEQVLACIDATRVPQMPQNIEQCIMCDADLHHFSRTDYLTYADNLKKEWAVQLGKTFANEVWAAMNLALLKKHQYFTAYGKLVLQQGKEANISLLQALLNDG